MALLGTKSSMKIRALSLVPLNTKQRIRFGCKIDTHCSQIPLKLLSKLDKYDMLIINSETKSLEQLAQELMDTYNHEKFVILYIASTILNMGVYTPDHEEIK